MINIIFLGLISFFADISAEMVYPIIPLYLTSAFGATPVLVGIIEGIAESTASLLKVFSGYVTDKYKKKKPIAFVGYATGLIYKLALILATSWAGILAARVIDRLGKGIRTSPRDVMVSESADGKNMGKAFGIHKALDMAGSAIGNLLSYFLLKNVAGNTSDYKFIFAISAVPAVMALCMFFFVKEKKEERVINKRTKFWTSWKSLDKGLKLYLFVVFIFTLGNSSNTFLLLRAKSAGFTDTSVILLYFIYNLTASFLAVPCGKISDKVGRKKVLIAGYIMFAIVYMGFGSANSDWMFVILFIAYGMYTAMSAGVERAYIAEISPKELKGTMLGLHSTIAGVALLPASIIAGFWWEYAGAFAPFWFGSTMALVAVVILIFFLKENKENNL